MAEEVLFRTKEKEDRKVVAEYLRAVAAKLEEGETLSLSAGQEAVALELPQEIEFSVKVERETSTKGGRPPKLSVELELEWREGQSSSDQDSGLVIE